MSELYIHSKCCNAHWDLHYSGGKYFLECSQCQKSVGPSIAVTGPSLDGCVCEECGKGSNSTLH